MVAPSYATNLTNITLAENTTGWSALGGGGAGLSASPDIAVEGTNAVDKQITNAEKGQEFSFTAVTPGANEHFYVWIANTTPGLINTLANRGLAMVAGNSNANLMQFHLTGSDVFKLEEAFYCWVIRYVNTTNTSRPYRTIWNGTPGTTVGSVGATMFTTTTVKGANLGVDAIRRGNTVTVTAGDSGTPATWDAFATYAHNSTRRWGIVQPSPGGATIMGGVIWGTGATAVYSRDSNRTIAVRDTEHSLSTLSYIEFNNASSDVVWDNVGLVALGTNARGRIIVNNNAPVTWKNSVLQGINTTTDGGTNSVWDGDTWTGCNAVTAAGGSFLNTNHITPTVAADASSLIWNLATDTNNKLNGSTFSKGTNAHHAINFGASSPTSVTLTDCTFTGFNTTTNEQNDSTFFVDKASGTMTINIAGSGTAAANLTYKRQASSTCTVTISGSVTVTVNVKDGSGNAIEGASVRVEQDPSGTLISQGSTNASGVYTFAYTGSTPQNVLTKVRLKGWVATTGTGSIVSGTGLTQNFTLTPDAIVNLP